MNHRVIRKSQYYKIEIMIFQFFASKIYMVRCLRPVNSKSIVKQGRENPKSLLKRIEIGGNDPIRPI